MVPGLFLRALRTLHPFLSAPRTVLYEEIILEKFVLTLSLRSGETRISLIINGLPESLQAADSK